MRKIFLIVFSLMLIFNLCAVTVFAYNSFEGTKSATGLRIGETMAMNQYAVATYLGKGLDANKNPVDLYKSKIYMIPQYLDDLKTRINPVWIRVGENYKSGDNIFVAETNGLEVKISYKNESMILNPQVKIGDKLCSPISQVKLLSVDPINENYKSNTLEWQYDGFVRHVRLIEGMIFQYLIFNENPNKTVDIGIEQKSAGYIWEKPVEAWDKDNKILKLDGTLLSKEQLSRSDIQYPITIDPTSSFTISASDGYGEAAVINASRTTSWDTTHDAANADVVTNASTIDRVVVFALMDGADYKTYIDRAYLYFNTAYLSEYVVSAANLYVYPGVRTYSLNATWHMDAFYGTATAYPHDPLVVGDFNYTLYSATTIGSLTVSNALSTSAYSTIALNATGYNNINVNGTTKMCLRQRENDLTDTTPSAGDYTGSGIDAINLWSYEKGTGYQPYLEVTYSVPTWSWYFPITITDTSGTARTNLSVDTGVQGTSLYQSGYLLQSGLDSNMQLGDNSVGYGLGTKNTFVNVTSLPAYGQVTYNLYTDYTVDGTNPKSIIPFSVGNTGYVTTLDNASLEPGANTYSIEAKGYYNFSGTVIPTIVNKTSSSGSSDTMSFVCPAGVVAGNILIGFCSGYANGGALSITAPAGWTELYDTDYSDSGYFLTACVYKVADGTESGTSVTCTDADLDNWATQTFQVENADIPYTTGDINSATGADPSYIWIYMNEDGLAKSLFFAVCTDSSDVTAYPTDYSNGVTNGAANYYLAVADRTVADEVQDPGVFTAASGKYNYSMVSISPSKILKVVGKNACTWMVLTDTDEVTVQEHSPALYRSPVSLTGLADGEYDIRIFYDGTYLGLQQYTNGVWNTSWDGTYSNRVNIGAFTLSNYAYDWIWNDDGALLSVDDILYTLNSVDVLEYKPSYMVGTASYTTGTASFTNGSATVSGIGTVWNQTMVKCIIKNDANGVYYIVDSVNTTNQTATLNIVYAGGTASGAYTIAPGLDDIQNNYNGIVTLGTNTGITVTYGAIQSYISTSVASTTEDVGWTAPTIYDANFLSAWFTSGTHISSLPLYGLYNDTATNTGIPVQTLYVITNLFFMIFFATLVIVKTRTVFMGLVAGDMVLLLGIFQTVYPAWILLVCIFLPVGILFVWRQQ